MDPREIVRECPWSHAVDGDCAEYVMEYQARGPGGDVVSRCPNCNRWRAPAGIAATHDKFGNPIPAAAAAPNAAERAAQAERCRSNCTKPDPDACPCQFLPDAETVAQRIAAMEPGPSRYAPIPHVRSAS